MNYFENANVFAPTKGKLHDVLDICEINAKEALDEHFLTAKLDDDVLNLLDKLGNILHIKTPTRIELFDKYLNPVSQMKLQVLDIGSKNWFYAGGEYFFFKYFCDSLKLDGVELDAYRLYTSLYSRYEVAKFYSKGLDGAEYIVGNLLDINKKYDYIIWFLPFVLEYPLIKWGLPLDEFRPLELFKHAYSLLNTRGVMFILNQGIEEYEEQQDIFRNIGIEYKLLGKVESSFLEYKYDRYASIVIKI